MNAGPVERANPFEKTLYGGIKVGVCDAADRLALVAGFCEAQCRAALLLPDLQKAVRAAIQKRLKTLNAAGN